MKKINRIIITIFLVVLVAFIIKYFIPTSSSPITNKESINQKVSFDNSEIKLDNKASILMNLNTNQVIYQNNIYQSLPVYSVSKTMFLATVSDYLKENKISFDKEIEVTKLIDSVNKNADFSSAGLQSNEKYTIKELYDAVMIPSGNDAAILLAYSLFGNHTNAVTKMNENAKKWGMKDSSFISTSGLDGKYLQKLGIDASDGKNLMSVYDSILLVKRIKKYYPEIIESGAKKEAYIGNRKISSVNKALEGLEFGYEGVYGLKTGSNIEKYSNNIIALKKDKYNQDIVAISFDSKTNTTRYQDINSLYNYLNTLEIYNIKDNLGLYPDFLYVNSQPKIGLKKDYYLYKPTNTSFELSLTNYSSLYNKQLNAFRVGNINDKIGSLSIDNNDLFFDGKAINISDVVIKENINEIGIFSKIKEFIIRVITK